MLRREWQVREHTGADYEYPYRSITTLDEETISKYCVSLRQRFKRVRNAPQASEQWIVRTYVALKYILASSLMLSSAEFALSRNLRIVEPYLLYYALFNVSRSLCLMIPEQAWGEGALLDALTHTKVQNLVSDCLRYFSADVASQFKNVSQRAMVSREMLSYKLPAEGLGGRLANVLPSFDDIVDLCQFVAEAAQLHSECLQTVFADLPDTSLPIDSKPLRRFFEYEHKSLENPLIDHEDGYRKWQFLRHSSKPWSLHLTAREGLVEDFFGAWAAEEGKPDQYDADKTDWHIIFDFF